MAPTEILPGLLLGDAQDAIAWAPSVGVAQKHALICVLEACPFNNVAPPYHFHVHLLGTAPDNKISPASLEAVAVMIRWLKFQKEWTVLVHCGAGIERSPLAVAWYLRGYEFGYLTLNDAYQFIMAKRPQVQDRQQWIADT